MFCKDIKRAQEIRQCFARIFLYIRTDQRRVMSIHKWFFDVHGKYFLLRLKINKQQTY